MKVYVVLKNIGTVRSYVWGVYSSYEKADKALMDIGIQIECNDDYDIQEITLDE
jgi:hypothetical protein